MTPEVSDYWRRAVQALRTSNAVSALFAFQQQNFKKHTALEQTVHRDLVKPGLWPVEAGRAFSWLVNLRYTGDYGGQEHVLPEDAKVAVERASLVLETVRKTAPEPLPDL